MEWAKKIEELSATRERKPEGENWFTADKFKAEANIGNSRCYKLLKEAREAGKLEIYNGCEFNEELGQLVRRVWYRFIDPN